MSDPTPPPALPTPTPAPALPTPTLADRPFGVGAAIGFGWRRTWRNFWRLLLVSIVFFAITFGVQLVTGLAGLIAGGAGGLGAEALGASPDAAELGFAAGNAGTQFIGAVVSLLVSLFLQLGLVRIALGVATGSPVELRRLFHFTGFGRFVGTSIVIVIAIAAALLITVGPGVWLTVATDQVAWAVIGGVVGAIIAIVLSTMFTFYAYAILDRDARGLSSLGVSWSIVRPRFWAVIGLQILIVLIVIGLLIGAIILGVLMLFVGLLITLPAVGVLIFGLVPLAWVYAYRTLAGEPVAV